MYILLLYLLANISNQAETRFGDDSIRLSRFIRQAANVPSSGQAASASGDTSSSSAEGLSGSEEKEEALGSLKCDFGTSDAPDLCKFKILESENPLSKGLSVWTHGSGKLALYQGGPLIDASDRNDTTGGYIFYETSNPYAAGASTANSFNRTSNSNYQATHIDSPSRRHNNPSEQAADYTGSIRSPYHLHIAGSGDTSGHDNFQQFSSARVLVSANHASSPSASPAFISPNLTAPGPAGMCLSFQYAIQGLSADELKVHVNDHKTERSRQIWSSSESAASNWTKGEVLYSATNIHSLVFAAAPSSALQGSNDVAQQRRFRGYIAIDEIEINKHEPNGADGPCKGHCNFDGDLCGWLNAENGQDDDFDWSFGRGSDNLFTGPARDYVSSLNNELTGSFLFTDSGYPRRPGDRALLMSPMFQPTAVNEAMCMRFAVHMFGSGVGSLAIKIRYADEGAAAPAGANPPALGTSPQSTSSSAAISSQGQAQPASPRLDSRAQSASDLVIWEMSGDSGNVWHQAQTSVSSAKSPFQVLIEGVIGENHLGNMAIDEISFSSGPCPTSPPVASKNYGDCTFEQSMCYWRNPDSEIHLDDLDWIRSADEQSIHGPNFDHTLKKRSGSYLKLENTFREPKSGTRAFLLSPIFQPKAQQGSVQCLSFYYYMFMRSISSSGPNLGTIRVYLASNNELVPIWRLTNPISSPSWKHGRASLSTAIIDGQPTAPTKLFQIAFEGIWGDASGGAIALDDITVFDGACDIMPAEAKSVPGECTFDTDMCSWTNKTTMAGSNGADDTSGGPFLQSVNNAAGQGYMPAKFISAITKRTGWQLATVDSRPVNLQDHTYKAPIGYAYVDVLDSSSSQNMVYTLQSAESTVQAGQQVSQCLSFWFAAYGRQDSNQLNVYLTQASAPPSPPEDGSTTTRTTSGGSVTSAGSSAVAGSSAGGALLSSTQTGSAEDSDTANAWKNIDGKLIWSISLRNMTEINRRKWQYGQVALKADSNYIVRFTALTSDGGFALDDISYYDGFCDARPLVAKVQSEEEQESPPPSLSKPASS